MITDKYDLNIGADANIFEFDSEGPKGRIRKIIQYTPINLKNYYNLGLGDKNLVTNKIDDLIVTDNKDSQKILMTVAATLFIFTDQNPDASILAIGSTLLRTRLYRIGITKNLELIERDFFIYGLRNRNWHSFEKGILYDAFLVKRKNLIS